MLLYYPAEQICLARGPVVQRAKQQRTCCQLVQIGIVAAKCFAVIKNVGKQPQSTCQMLLYYPAEQTCLARGPVVQRAKRQCPCCQLVQIGIVAAKCFAVVKNVGKQPQSTCQMLLYYPAEQTCLARGPVVQRAKQQRACCQLVQIGIVAAKCFAVIKNVGKQPQSTCQMLLYYPAEQTCLARGPVVQRAKQQCPCCQLVQIGIVAAKCFAVVKNVGKQPQSTCQMLLYYPAEQTCLARGPVVQRAKQQHTCCQLVHIGIVAAKCFAVIKNVGKRPQSTCQMLLYYPAEQTCLARGPVVQRAKQQHTCCQLVQIGIVAAKCFAVIKNVGKQPQSTCQMLLYYPAEQTCLARGPVVQRAKQQRTCCQLVQIGIVAAKCFAVVKNVGKQPQSTCQMLLYYPAEQTCLARGPVVQRAKQQRACCQLVQIGIVAAKCFAVVKNVGKQPQSTCQMLLYYPAEQTCLARGPVVQRAKQQCTCCQLVQTGGEAAKCFSKCPELFFQMFSFADVVAVLLR